MAKLTRGRTELIFLEQLLTPKSARSSKGTRGKTSKCTARMLTRTGKPPNPRQGCEREPQLVPPWGCGDTGRRRRHRAGIRPTFPYTLYTHLLTLTGSGGLFRTSYNLNEEHDGQGIIEKRKPCRWLNNYTTNFDVLIFVRITFVAPCVSHQLWRLN
jgi:hypothetical protein